MSFIVFQMYLFCCNRNVLKGKIWFPTWIVVILNDTFTILLIDNFICIKIYMFIAQMVKGYCAICHIKSNASGDWCTVFQQAQVSGICTTCIISHSFNYHNLVLFLVRVMATCHIQALNPKKRWHWLQIQSVLMNHQLQYHQRSC